MVYHSKLDPLLFWRNRDLKLRMEAERGILLYISQFFHLTVKDCLIFYRRISISMIHYLNAMLVTNYSRWVGCRLLKYNHC